MQETCVWSQGWEGLLEKKMATHSCILAWEIRWTEKPDALQSMGSQRVRHDLLTKQQYTQHHVWISDMRVSWKNPGGILTYCMVLFMWSSFLFFLCEVLKHAKLICGNKKLICGGWGPKDWWGRALVNILGYGNAVLWLMHELKKLAT